MASNDDNPVDLYIAAYSDAGAAQADWDAIKQLAKDKAIMVDGLVLVSRDADGKIDVKDDFHVVGGAATLGAAGGLLVGLIFPPAFLASGVVGAGIGAGVGGLVSHKEKKEIKAEVADDLPPNSSGIVALVRGAVGECGRPGTEGRRRRLKAPGRQGRRRAGQGRDRRHHRLTTTAPSPGAQQNGDPMADQAHDTPVLDLLAGMTTDSSRGVQPRRRDTTAGADRSARGGRRSGGLLPDEPESRKRPRHRRRPGRGHSRRCRPDRGHRPRRIRGRQDHASDRHRDRDRRTRSRGRPGRVTTARLRRPSPRVA